MPQVLVISDANVLIDMEAGGLLRPMFRLDYRFAVPDVLFEIELRQHHPGLARLGLRKMELTGESVRYVETCAEMGKKSYTDPVYYCLLLVARAWRLTMS